MSSSAAPIGFIALLDALPPVLALGAGLALLLILAWFVLVQRGTRYVWNGACRLFARGADRTIGVLLLPDYLSTTRRRKAGRPPSRAVFAIGRIAEPILHATKSLYERHPPLSITWKAPPWKLCVLILLGSIAAWGAIAYLEARKLRGTDEPNRIFGTPRNDRIDGMGGRDYLNGQTGDDTIFGGIGNDRLIGGAGQDRLSDRIGRDVFSASSGNDRVNARDQTTLGRGRADTVRCGTGTSDLAIVDRADRVAQDCERVDRR